MPHISAYIKEALEEEKYGDEFNKKIGMFEFFIFLSLMISLSNCLPM